MYYCRALTELAAGTDLMYGNRAVYNTDGVVLATKHNAGLCVPRRQRSQRHQLQCTMLDALHVSIHWLGQML